MRYKSSVSKNTYDSKIQELETQDSLHTSEIDSVQANLITGVRSYINLADLPATGTLNISYKITNDSVSSANNGFYTWNGSAYVKDAELILGNVLKGETAAVNGDKVYKEVNITPRIGKIFKNTIDVNSTIPIDGFIDLKVTDFTDLSTFYTVADPTILKELFLVYIRKGTLGGTSTILQIGEKIGGSVGLSLNTFASFSGDFDPTTDNVVTLKGTGIELDITLNWDAITSTQNLTTQIPLNSEYLLIQAKALKNNNNKINFPFWKNPTNTEFDYTSFLDLEVVSGGVENFYKSDGTLKELFLTFIRFVGLDDSPPSTNIIQIAWKNGVSVGLGDETFASVQYENESGVRGDDTRDMTGGLTENFFLYGSANFAGVIIRVIVDTSKIPNSILGSATLGDTLEIETNYLVEKLRKKTIYQPLQGIKGAMIGDSVVEFGNIPKLIAENTGAVVHKIGFGGCHLAERSDSADYNALGMVKISEAIKNDDFTAMGTSVTNLANLPTPDDNSVAYNLLASLDFTKLDFLSIAFCTNDFTGNKVIGSTGSINTFEIKGAINKIVENILSVYPHLRIVFFTPTHRFHNTNDDSDTVPNGIGNYLIEYCDAIVDEAELNHLPTFNRYRSGGLNKYNHFLYFDTDNVHPNDFGDKFIAERDSAFLTSIFKK